MPRDYGYITQGLLDEYSVNPNVQNATWAKARLQEDLKQSFSFSGKEMVKTAYMNASSEAYAIMGVIADTYAKSMSARKGSFRQMYQQVGMEALASVGRSYAARRSSQAPPYRANTKAPFERYAGGKLARALADPKMFRAASDGIEFVNQPWLDTQARQWYRLQWGAGPGQGREVGPRRPGVATSRIVLFGQQAGTMGISGRPSANFYVPRGTFTQGQFIPANYAAGQEKAAIRQKHSSAASIGAFARPDRKSVGFWGGGMSKSGIAAQHYLESGVATIARLAPANNEKLLGLLAAEAMELGTGPLAKAAVSQADLQAIRQMAEASKAILSFTGKEGAQIKRVMAGVTSFGPRGQRFR